MLILAIDLGKTKSLACWYQTDDTSPEFRTVPTRPGDFQTLLAERRVDRVVIEICDAAGWIDRNNGTALNYGDYTCIFQSCPVFCGSMYSWA